MNRLVKNGIYELLEIRLSLQALPSGQLQLHFTFYDFTKTENFQLSRVFGYVCLPKSTRFQEVFFFCHIFEEKLKFVHQLIQYSVFNACLTLMYELIAMVS